MRSPLTAFALLLAALATIAARPVYGLDPESTDALNQTLQLLQDESTRPGRVPGVAPGSDLDRALQSSPELRKELYDVAGDVFRDMVQQSGGDVGAMSRVVEQGQGDPAAFESSLSGATANRIHELARKLDAAGH